MSLVVIVGMAVAYGSFLLLLRARKVPVLVSRVWFTFCLAVSVLVSFLVCKVIAGLLKANCISKTSSEKWCRLAKTIVFRALFFLHIQHIRVVLIDGSLPLDTCDNAALTMCHSSFFDPLLSLCLCKLRFMAHSKTFVKSSLLKLPLFGYVLKCCGYFPVYFADENGPSFSVNKEKQASVAAETEAFVKDGNYIAFFPEGAINRHPETLLDFRRGSFHTIVEHKMPLVYIVMYGDHEVWNPSLKGLPGYPADIYLRVGRYEYDATTADPMKVAAGLRDEMQKHLNDMLAIREKRGYKSFYVAPPKRD